MRDPNRLDSFYGQLKALHKAYCPDWRFSQLLSNAMVYYKSDLFYAEEDEMLDKVRTYLKSLKK